MPSKLSLIYVHMPKTGGASVMNAFKTSFGGDRLYLDFADRPADPTSKMNMDPLGFLDEIRSSGYAFLDGRRAITGHFWIEKYAPVDAEVRATILREPIERAISQYFYWRSIVPGPHFGHRYVVDNDLSFDDFARLPTVCSIYTQYFYRGVDMRIFDYVGESGDLLRNWSAVFARMGLSDAAYRRINTTAELDGDYASRAEDIRGDAAKMAHLRTLFRHDIEFYERWVQRL